MSAQIVLHFCKMWWHFFAKLKFHILRSNPHDHIVVAFYRATKFECHPLREPPWAEKLKIVSSSTDRGILYIPHFYIYVQYLSLSLFHQICTASDFPIVWRCEHIIVKKQKPTHHWRTLRTEMLPYERMWFIQDSFVEYFMLSILRI